MADGVKVGNHYGSADISARIISALRAADKNLDRLTRADLSPFDEFHGGGLASTRALAKLAGMRAGMQVVDLGCGIGGPARTLADEFGCSVTGIDVTEEFIRAATLLTEHTNMGAQCKFVHGSATATPLADGVYDCVWSQNMMMNVANKAELFAEVWRLLKPGGLFAFEAVLAGSVATPHLPTFWAAHSDINHLVTWAKLEDLFAQAGLEVVTLRETTADVIKHGRRRKAAFEQQDPHALTIHVIVPDNVEGKMSNALLNNEQGRTRTITGVCRKPA
jgi:ubiquinone/menaquinone biosynthesis C-methylase UbiE